MTKERFCGTLLRLPTPLQPEVTVENNRAILVAFIIEQQRRETELRRLQNCVVYDAACGYVAVVDTSWSSLAEPDDDVETRTPHFGVIPVSEVAHSNWHVGNDRPFVLASKDNPDLGPTETEVTAPWVTFRVTSETTVLCMRDGERILVEWGQEGCSEDGNFHICAFRTGDAAQNWASSKASELTS